MVPVLLKRIIMKSGTEERVALTKVISHLTTLFTPPLLSSTSLRLWQSVKDEGKVGAVGIISLYTYISFTTATKLTWFES